MNKNQLLSALHPVCWTLAVKRAIGITPGCLRSSSTSISEPEISAWRTRWIMILETRRLFSPCRFHPTQSLQCRKVDDKTVESAPPRFVRHSRQILLSQFLNVSRFYGTLLTPRLFLLQYRGAVHCCSSHQCCLVVVEDISLASTNLRVD